jgi:hypothetical protein
MKYIIKFGKDSYPIAEDEIPKIIKAMDEKLIVVLKSGVFSGAFISAIVKDIHAENGWNYGYEPRGEDKISRGDYATDIANILATPSDNVKYIDHNDKLLK